MTPGPTFRARVRAEVGAELAEVDGVQWEGERLTCSPAGLFNLKVRGGTLFIADGGAVLVRPGSMMLLFKESRSG